MLSYFIFFITNYLIILSVILFGFKLAHQRQYTMYTIPALSKLT